MVAVPVLGATPEPGPTASAGIPKLHRRRARVLLAPLDLSLALQGDLHGILAKEANDQVQDLRCSLTS